MAEAKSRLAPHLSVAQRRELVLQLLQRTVDVLRASHCIARIVVVSPDNHVLGEDVMILPDVGGLNESLQNAIEWVVKKGMDRALVVQGDLPYLVPEDIRAMLNVGTADRSVVLSRTQDGGTGALCVRPPTAITPMFGPDSYSKHLTQTRRARCEIHQIERRGLCSDLDTLQDLREAQHHGHFRDVTLAVH